MRNRTTTARRVFAIVIAVALVATFVGYAAGRGLGAPSIPSDAIAVVQDSPDGTVTKAEFQQGLEQTAKQQGVSTVPKPSDPQYATIKDAAISDLLLSRWIRGEAEERGITISDTQVSDQLKKIIQQQFGGQKQFAQFLKQQGFTEQDARDRVGLQLMSDQIQQEVLPQNPPISSDEIQAYYDQNIAQFQQPASRDVRLILNKDKAKVEAAQQALGSSPSAADWKKVAKKYSTDAATKTNGGLRQAVTKGQSEPVLDDRIFSSSLHQLVGPFKSQSGWYLIDVEKITAAKTTPLSSVSSQIKQQLVSAKQQQIAASFQTDFTDKWVSRTYCADGYVTDRCANFTPPVQLVPGSAIVASTRPAAPACVSGATRCSTGFAALIFGTAPSGAPQGPLQPAVKTPAGGTPIPLGTPGAPTVPGQPPAPPPTGG